MRNFAIRNIPEITGHIKFFKLEINGKCQFDEFWGETEESGNLKSELRKAQTIMQEVSDNKFLPKTKFRNITPQNETLTEFEIKTKHLRIYLFHEKHTGRIIVYGGKKTSQKKDIKRFRNIKKEYFDSKKS